VIQYYIELYRRVTFFSLGEDRFFILRKRFKGCYYVLEGLKILGSNDKITNLDERISRPSGNLQDCKSAQRDIGL